MKPVALTITFHFETDWGVGTGTGRGGDLDSVIAKDAVGLPMLPAKTVTGMLRSACEEAARALGDGTDSWDPVVRWLFGDQPSVTPSGRRPMPAALSIRPAQMSETTRDYVDKATPIDQLRLRAAATVVRPSTAIDPITGTAKAGSLRFEERGRAGQVLTSTASLDCAGPLPADAETLLACGAALLERVGGNRRRGAGWCTVEIESDRRLVPHWDATPVDRSGSRPIEREAGERDQEASPWTRIGEDADQGPLVLVGEWDLTCRTPVAAASEVRGNVVIGHDFVPGTMLLPIVARAIGPSAADLIARSRLVVTDANPVSHHVRLLPVPMCWQKPKGTSGSLHNALTGRAKSRTVPVRRGWVDPLTAPSCVDDIHTRSLEARAHAVIDDQRQRPTEESGGLFVMEAIPAGTVLRFQVWAPEGTRVGMPESAVVGRSKKDDYGHVSIADAHRADSGVAREAAGSDQDALTVWLTSDMVLLDEHLTQTTSASAVAECVAAALGVRVDTDGGGVEAFTSVRRHEGWSTATGLPRPSLTAIHGGTVLRFPVEETPAADAIARVEREGVGQRTVEGFGRVLINPPCVVGSAPIGQGERVLTQSQPKSDRRPKDPPDRPASDDTAAEQLWRSAVESWLAEVCADAALNDQPDVLNLATLTPSQLGTLREAVLAPADRGRVSLTKGVESAVEHEDFKVLRSLLRTPDLVWTALGVEKWSGANPEGWSARARKEYLLRSIIRAQRSLQAAERRQPSSGPSHGNEGSPRAEGQR